MWLGSSPNLIAPFIHTGLLGGNSMFDSLDEQIKKDEHKSVSNKERAMFWTVAILASVAIFGGIYAGMHYMQP